MFAVSFLRFLEFRILLQIVIRYDFPDFEADSSNLEQVILTQLVSWKVEIGARVLGDHEPQLLLRTFFQDCVQCLVHQTPVENPKSARVVDSTK